MIILILILSFLLRLINLGQSFWLDEAAQVIESSRPLIEQFSLPADFHPPLYHLLLHFWMYLGKSEVWVRLLSVFLALGSIVLLYRLALHFGGKKESLLAAFFLAISPYHLWYSQEARPYMLFVFVSLLSTNLLIRKKWFFYTLAITLSLYSHYFVLFLFIGHGIFLYLFGRKDLRKFVRSLFFAFVLFLPWLPSLIRQLEVGTGSSFSGWTEVVSVFPIKAIPLTFAKFIVGKSSIQNNFFYGLVLVPIFSLFIFSLIKIFKRKEGEKLLVLFFVPLIGAFFTSFFIPVIAPQRLIFLLPLFYLILAKGVNKFTSEESKSLLCHPTRRWRVSEVFISLPRCEGIRVVFVFLVCAISLYGLFDYYTNPYTQREQWRGAVSFVEERGDRKSVALFVFPEPFAPYLWYNKGLVEARGIAPDFILKDKDLANLQEILLGKKRVYLFQYLTGLTDPKEKARYFLPSLGLREVSIKDFPGVGFIYVFEKV